MSANKLTIDFDDLDSIAEAVSLGITSPEQVANHLGLDLVDDALVLENCPMYADDGNAEIAYDSDTTAKEAAQEYVDSGDWDSDNKTSWITVYTYRKGVNASGQVVDVDRDSHKIAIEPTEPDCEDGFEHVWQSPLSLVGGCKENPGVFGHGGGVIINEVCMVCGCKKTTDTWAQDTSDGEQGLTRIEYSEGEYCDEVNDRAIKRAKSHLDTNFEQSDDFDFVWENEDGHLVGASDDELLDLGRRLLTDDSATITGSPISTQDAN